MARRLCLRSPAIRWPGAIAALVLVSGALGSFAAPAGAAAPVTPSTTAAPAESGSDGSAELGASQVIQSGDITIHAYYCSKKTPTQTYTVPQGVHSLYVEAVGGQGQTPNPDHTGLGGLGGQVTGGLSVNPGDVFRVQVGCAGGADGGASAYAPGGRRGTGWAHLNYALTVYSYGYDGGGGGGASAVLAGTKPLAVAGGGGGAAGNAPDCTESRSTEEGGVPFFFYCGGRPVEQGGDGGNGGGGDQDGTVGQNNPGASTPSGGNCEGTNRGGAKGSNFHDLGGGGAGGGGGGGYSGGCGGDAGPAANIDSPNSGNVKGAAGNGGGGGQSYTDVSLQKADIATADDAGDGYVLFLTSADGVRSTHFDFTGHPESFCVPDGVDELFVDALGGAGGGGGHDFRDVGTGGSGSGVQAVIPVTERTQLQVSVGQYGHASGGWGDGHGGKRGTADSAASNSGAGGGGSTAVQQSTTGCGTSPLTGLQRVVVAGGGGGGGGNGAPSGGGNGGAAGNPAHYGQVGDAGGGEPGCPGLPPGQGCNGSRNGGEGTNSSTGGGGGGGGGGYDGGGKGHGATDGFDGGGGGGGGGRSYVTPASPQPVHYYQGPPGDYGNKHGLNEGKVGLVVPVPAHRSQIQIVSGNKQSANPGDPFAQPLVMRYVDAVGGPTANVPINLTITPTKDQPASFSTGGTTDQVITDAKGEARVNVTSAPNRPAGQFVVQAAVANDPAHLIQASEFTLLNTLRPTDIALTSSTPDNESASGQPVQFTASMTSPAQQGAAVTTGLVQFSVDGNNLGSPVVANAHGEAASPPISELKPGAHHVLASYTDTVNLQAPVFTSLGQSVSPAPGSPRTTTTVGMSPNAGVGVAGVVLFAKITPSAAEGTVTFSRDYSATPIPGCEARPINATAPASFGYAACVTTFPTAGAHTISATYSGDATHPPVTMPVTVSVTATPDFFQITLGLLIEFAHNVHVFGL